MVDLDHRIDLAATLRREGCNCAKTVVVAFKDMLDVEPETAGRIAEGLGGGVGGCGLTCGCVSASAMILASAKPDLNKPLLYKEVASVVDEFKARFGSTECRALKRELKVPCNDLIFHTITMLHQRLCVDC